MNKNRVVGAGKQVAGAAKVAIGKIVGDAKLQADGKAEKAEGKIQNMAGGVEDVLKGG